MRRAWKSAGREEGEGEDGESGGGNWPSVKSDSTSTICTSVPTTPEPHTARGGCTGVGTDWSDGEAGTGVGIGASGATGIDAGPKEDGGVDGSAKEDAGVDPGAGVKVVNAWTSPKNHLPSTSELVCFRVSWVFVPKGTDEPVVGGGSGD